MSRLCKRIPLLLLLLSIVLVPRALAAQYALYGQTDSQGWATLELGGITDSVYALQLELLLPGQYDAITYTPSVSGAYSPGAQVTAEERQTRVTIYLDSQTPMNSGSSLSVGVLSASRAVQLPSSGKLTLLGRDLTPLAGVDGTAVSLSASPSSTVGGGTLGITYEVSVTPTSGGTVTPSPTRAQNGQTVKLTVKPEQGYRLDTLRVRTKGGKSLWVSRQTAGLYSFVMPREAVLVEGVFVPNDAALPFGDVARTDWFYDAVRFVYAQGMMVGTSDRSFSPGVGTTRGMVVTVLYRLEGSPASAPAGFTDVPPSMYYTAAVDWAAEQGIVSGYGDGRFGADDPITREQLTAILYRYARYRGYEAQPTGTLGSFTDSSAVSSYAAEAMGWAVGSGLLNGKQGNVLDPKAGATRAELATMLTRFFQSR